MKHRIRLTEMDINRIVRKSVNRVLTEVYDQWADSDFAGDGDPYGLVDDDYNENDYTLDGYYGSFNNIYVKIEDDGKPSARIIVGDNNSGEEKTFIGDKAQTMLDKIRKDTDVYGNVNTSIYRNLYKYVL